MRVLGKAIGLVIVISGKSLWNFRRMEGFKKKNKKKTPEFGSSVSVLKEWVLNKSSITNSNNSLY